MKCIRTIGKEDGVELGVHDSSDEAEIGSPERGLGEFGVGSVCRLGEGLEDLLDDGQNQTVEDVEQGVLQRRNEEMGVRYLSGEIVGLLVDAD